MKHVHRLGLAAAMIAGANVAAQAEVVVVAARGAVSKAYALGQKLDDRHSIVLKAGDKLTLLKGGQTRHIQGPGTFVAGASARVRSPELADRVRRVASIGSALARAAPRAPVFTALHGRALGGEPRAPTFPNLNIWTINPASQKVCYLPKINARVWRGTAWEEETFRIQSRSSGEVAELSFPAKEARAAWPETLPRRDGAAYEVVSTDPTQSWHSRTYVRKPSCFQFREVQPAAGELPDDELVDHYASEFARLGCRDQLELLLRALEEGLED